MKIPLLLVQFLYKNRRLALPGIGIFTLDKSIVLPEENDRDLLSAPNGVQFQNANIASADRDLISYIVENTGKITPLAISDLESYLTLGMEMLNIGKPFYLEGIGTITKNKAGKFDFSPGEYTVIKDAQATGHDHPRKKKSEPQPADSGLESAQNRRLLKVVAVIAALIIIACGGYLMYKKMSPPAENNTPTGDSLTQAVVAPDSATPAPQTDSAKPARPAGIPAAAQPPRKDSVLYKFVILATDNKAYALKRYRQLLGFDLKPHFFERDSTFFKVYFQFPALNKDTIAIKDSLRRQYAHGVQIEE